MTKIIVTGSAGQVGHFLVKKLNEQKTDFLGIDIKNPTIKFNHKFAKVDLRNLKDIRNNKEQLRKFDVLIHLAGLIDDETNIIKYGIQSLDYNIKTTLNLLEFLPRLKQICFASTYMVYGIPISNPVKEIHPTEPFNVYAASKLINEKFLQVYSQKQNIDLTILRFMSIYGVESPIERLAIPSFIKKIVNDEKPIIFGTGKPKRNQIYIDDAIEAILTSIRKRKPGIFNIGGEDSTSLLEYIDLINNELGKNIKPIFKKRTQPEYDFITDISKAKKELGFRPRVNIMEGLSKTIKRYYKTKKK